MPEKVAIQKKFNDNPCLQKVLQLYADGFNSRAIARILNKQAKTVENQFEIIKATLRAATMCRAVVVGIKFGIIEARDVEEE